jgi:hypothetical protein
LSASRCPAAEARRSIGCMTEDHLEKAIGDAIARGDFDDLPGAGKRIEGLDATYDPAWWAKGFVGRERAREAGIELIAEIDRALPALLATRPLDEVLDRIREWNVVIARISTELDAIDRLHPLDPGAVEERWRRLRG